MMHTVFCDVAVIGAGPAGLAAAIAAKQEGAANVLLIERDTAPGGILQQCIHPGFGLQLFREELTGPEYAGRFVKEAREAGVELLSDTMVLSIGEDHILTCANPEKGLLEIHPGAIVLAMGCRERTRANIRIPGERPAGVYTAGTAQRLINRQNAMVGRRVVILGSGDIGMIMARRMTLEGAKVEAVVELLPYLAGLTRNRVQCLDDFDIPLLLSHTVTAIEGKRRVEAVRIAQVDQQRRPIPETERTIPCDTLLLSVGLIPENELTRAAGIEMDSITNGPSVDQRMETSRPGIFACGNVVHVNDLVDNVTAESRTAGACAARYALGTLPRGQALGVAPGSGVRYVCPQRLDAAAGGKAALYFRVAAPGGKTTLTARCGETVLARRTVPRVSPGEMCRLDIDTAHLTAPVTVEAQEVEA